MDRRSFVKLTVAALAALSGFGAAVNGWLSPAGKRARLSGSAADRVICLGLDGMDPDLLSRFMDQGLLPHFSRLATMGDFKVCGTSIPPQSPVAWSSFITGQDPGGHGIFDFIHRDPETMVPKLSLAEARPPTRFLELGDWKLPRSGGSVELLRRGRAFWEYLAEDGVDVTVFKMPSNYPPVDCRVRSISGMGTPDILGTYGIYSLFTDDPPRETDPGGGRIVPVALHDHRFTSFIPGPPNSYRRREPETRAPLSVVVDPVRPVAKIETCGKRLLLNEGEWSDWVTLRFPLIPHLKEVTGICRFYLMEVRPRFRLYVSPVQIDPVDPVMPISTPDDYARELAENVGPFYTQGLPDDTKALDEGVFDDDDYVGQADIVLAERLRQYHYELSRFRQVRRGFLFFYFNSLDQNCHMFWRSMDPESPMHRAADRRHEARIRDLYVAMDGVLGEAMELLDDGTALFVVSDHGFAPYRRSFHLNTWLLENGYLAIDPGLSRDDVAYLGGINWRRTVAYGLGINGLYLNLKGRERCGRIRPGPEAEAIATELVDALMGVTDPRTGEKVFKRVYRADQVYHGEQSGQGPDIVLGYRRGYRGSNETALGKVSDVIFEDNLLKWSGDHCMAAEEVPGILLSNRKITAPAPSLQDMAPTFLHLFGLRPSAVMAGRDILA
jgi:predicted AlkP superfamily phosphohydrolase/phosphomutase